MTIKEKTLKMKKWAVVGATDKTGKFGYKIFKRLLEHGYEVYPVNPNIDYIEGHICFNSISEIEQSIDVVDMVVNPEIGISVMKEISERDIEYVWLQPGARSERIKNYAEKKGINIIEDCIYATLE
ncbi:MAG: CoA-binding protein [Halanaerobiales bacterium]